MIAIGGTLWLSIGRLFNNTTILYKTTQSFLFISQAAYDDDRQKFRIYFELVPPTKMPADAEYGTFNPWRLAGMEVIYLF